MLTIDTPMDESIFLIQELNPFQEWHTHASENKLGHAFFFGREDLPTARGSVFVLSRTDHVVALLKPKTSNDLAGKSHNN